MKEVSEILIPRLEAIQNSFSGIFPELLLTLTFLALLLIDLFVKKRKNAFLHFTTIAGISVALYLLTLQWETIGLKGNMDLFLGMLSLTSFSVFFKFLFSISSLITVLFLLGNEPNSKQKGLGEFYEILLLSLIGLNCTVMAENLLMLYLSIEFVSISGYILVLFLLNKQSAEGSLKYFLFGVISSAVMLYGMSLLYGLSGSLAFEGIFSNTALNTNNTVLLLVLFLTLGGFLFKTALFPFHFWTPDVYEAAPTSVSAFLSVAPKAAGFAVILKLFYPLFQQLNRAEITIVLSTLAFITLAIGNFSAIWQNNGKRLLAYSSIAHSGFILLGIIAFSNTGIKSVIYYTSIFLPMNFAAFILVQMVSDLAGSEDVRKFAGIGIKFPLTGVIFVIVMIALTGLPPTAGFYAKLFVFSALWETYQASGNELLLYLLLFGLLNTVVALFYYLKIPYIMFFKESKGDYNPIKNSLLNKTLVSLLAFVILWIFFSPEWLMEHIDTINLNFLHIPL